MSELLWISKHINKGLLWISTHINSDFLASACGWWREKKNHHGGPCSSRDPFLVKQKVKCFLTSPSRVTFSPKCFSVDRKVVNPRTLFRGRANFRHHMWPPSSSKTALCTYPSKDITRPSLFVRDGPTSDRCCLYVHTTLSGNVNLVKSFRFRAVITFIFVMTTFFVPEPIWGTGDNFVLPWTWWNYEIDF